MTPAKAITLCSMLYQRCCPGSGQTPCAIWSMSRNVRNSLLDNCQSYAYGQTVSSANSRWSRHSTLRLALVLFASVPFRSDINSSRRVNTGHFRLSRVGHMSRMVLRSRNVRPPQRAFSVLIDRPDKKGTHVLLLGMDVCLYVFRWPKASAGLGSWY